MSTNESLPTRIVSDLLTTDPDLIDIVQEFVDGLGGRVTELQKAFDQQNWDMLTTLAHRLKGAGGSYGYPEISGLGAEMERCFKAHVVGEFDSWIVQLQALTNAARNGLHGDSQS